MNDYKELIKVLRSGAWSVYKINSPAAMCETIYNAQIADAIEELVKERDELKAEMEYLANDPNAPIEMFCKKWTTHGCCCYNENGERISECEGFEWRGVQE